MKPLRPVARGALHLTLGACSFLGLASLQIGTPVPTAPQTSFPKSPLDVPWNVLLFILDDVGVEQLAVYDEINDWTPGYPYAPTPNIDAFAAGGILFTSFYASPLCTPTRASLLTGQRVHRHKIGTAANSGDTVGLAQVPGKLLTTLLAEHPAPVSLACVGKWHLGPGDDDPSHPSSVGRFRTYSGKLENTSIGPHVNGGAQDWNNYRYTTITDGGAAIQHDVVGGANLQVATYHEMHAFALEHASPAKLFMLQGAFHFTHTPYLGAWLDPDLYRDPVSGEPYHGYGPSPDLGELEIVHVIRMMTQSADTMIGGVWSNLSPEQQARTVVIIMSDNGSAPVTLSPQHSPSLKGYNPSGVYDRTRFKHTVFQGGIRVPLIIYGGQKTGIAAGIVSDALCEVADLHVTIAEAFGLQAQVDPLVDGVSLWPILRGQESEVRAYAFSQRHSPLGADPADYDLHRAALVNQGRWKLIEQDGVEELYHLPSDPFEDVDRLGEPGEAFMNYADLRAELSRILSEVP